VFRIARIATAVAIAETAPRIIMLVNSTLLKI
jgi:hypothetical protein